MGAAALLLSLLSALAVAVAFPDYPEALCVSECGAKRVEQGFTDPNSIEGEQCLDNGPCGALVFPGRCA